ncbi:hypothetical protein AMTR_s00072p00166270 [Amborella trichopoda]|uniref:Uncharacterized protein n=1 Tax=Amborella trichopoda TaxID=13333 RepID=W1NPC5_AMBTC|nr:hypothetical protein AMTR_s00072p00166270 [Amborella trichopoda]
MKKKKTGKRRKLERERERERTVRSIGFFLEGEKESRRRWRVASKLPQREVAETTRERLRRGRSWQQWGWTATDDGGEDGGDRKSKDEGGRQVVAEEMGGGERWRQQRAQ